LGYALNSLLVADGRVLGQMREQTPAGRHQFPAVPGRGPDHRHRLGGGDAVAEGQLGDLGEPEEFRQLLAGGSQGVAAAHAPSLPDAAGRRPHSCVRRPAAKAGQGGAVATAGTSCRPFRVPENALACRILCRVPGVSRLQPGAPAAARCREEHPLTNDLTPAVRSRLGGRFPLERSARSRRPHGGLQRVLFASPN
jgi:hypothetical protein